MGWEQSSRTNRKCLPYLGFLWLGDLGRGEEGNKLWEGRSDKLANKTYRKHFTCSCRRSNGLVTKLAYWISPLRLIFVALFYAIMRHRCNQKLLCWLIFLGLLKVLKQFGIFSDSRFQIPFFVLGSGTQEVVSLAAPSRLPRVAAPYYQCLLSGIPYDSNALNVCTLYTTYIV